MSSPKLLNDRYRLERKLGSGGMAIVWLARDEKLDRPVAVKVLSDVLASAEGYRQRFDREARTAANLSHPNLVSVYDYEAEGERPYLVMEYVAGETLAERIARSRLGGQAAERLARELLGALGAIHGAGVVHRDVKPANVLIDDKGEAHLTDFGIAQTADATSLTNTGHVIGTKGYMAPEVFEGEEASARSDLYSCGVLLRESAADPEDGRLAALIARLTESDPARRPATAAAALGALEGTAPDPAPPETTRRLARRRRRPQLRRGPFPQSLPSSPGTPHPPLGHCRGARGGRSDRDRRARRRWRSDGGAAEQADPGEAGESRAHGHAELPPPPPR